MVIGKNRIGHKFAATFVAWAAVKERVHGGAAALEILKMVAATRDI
jgi:hypothetical protein